MEISKQSWHYKLVCNFNNEPSNSLCKYFWQVVGSALIWLIMTVIGLSMAIVTTLFPIAAIIIAYFYPSDVIMEESFILSEVFIGGALLLMVYAIVTMYWAVKRIGQFIYRKYKKKAKPDKEPNVAIEYIKAKKQKICPTLNFK